MFVNLSVGTDIMPKRRIFKKSKFSERCLHNLRQVDGGMHGTFWHARSRVACLSCWILQAHYSNTSVHLQGEHINRFDLIDLINQKLHFQRCHCLLLTEGQRASQLALLRRPASEFIFVLLLFYTQPETMTIFN